MNHPRTTHEPPNPPNPPLDATETDSPTTTTEGNAKPRNTYPDAFEKWWQLYPKRVGKGAALKAWQKATGGKHPLVDHDTLNQATRRYAQARHGQDPRFTKHPQGWLNERRWEDQPPPAYTGPARTPGELELDALLGLTPTTPTPFDERTIDHDPIPPF